MTMTVKPMDMMRRLACLLLIALLLTCSYILPTAHAALGAVAAAAGAKEVIAGILIAGGVAFASSAQARDTAGKVWDALVDKGATVVNTLTTLVGMLANPASGLTRGFRVSRSAFDAIVSTYWTLRNKNIITDSWRGHVYDICIIDSVSEMKKAFEDEKAYPYLYDGLYKKGRNYRFPAILVETTSESCLFYGEKTSTYSYTYSRKDGVHTSTSSYPITRVWTYIGTAGTTLPSNDYLEMGVGYTYITEDGSYYSTSQGKQYLGDFPVTLTFFDEIAVTNDVVYPSDESLVLAPDLPSVELDEDGKELVTYPHDLSLNPSDHVVDIPIDAGTGDKVQVPYDVPVNVGTGQQVGTGEGVGEGEGTGEGVGEGSGVTSNIFQRFWDWLKGLLEAIRDGILGLLTAITSFFDSPSDFSLDFSGFQNLILPDRFPFCIPFDLVASVRVFAASAANFTFKIDLDTQYFSIHHTVDLSPYAVPIAFFRYTCVAWFVWVLILRTRDMIKW